jgi:hypothetical protein
MSIPSSLAAVLATSIAASAASAQTSPEESARIEFESGEAAFDSSDYDLALRHFRRAYELVPRDGVLFNVGVCLERLGRNREAVESYERAARSASLDEETRAQARDFAARARQRLGTIVVTGEPRGAAVLVDGEELCELPCRIEVDFGMREVVVRAPDGTEASDRLDVPRGGIAEAELAAVRARERTVSTAIVTEPEANGLGALGWTGIGLMIAGAGCIVGCGLYTESLGDDYLMNPTAETRDTGLAMRAITNVSIGVAGLGAVLLVLDLALFAFDDDEPETEAETGAESETARR